MNELETLEKQKQNILIKLNNVFGNPQKERNLNLQLEEIETKISKIRNNQNEIPAEKTSYLSEMPVEEEFSLDDVEITAKENKNTGEKITGKKVDIEPDTNLPISLKSYEEKAINGDAYSQCYLAICYLKAKGANKNYNRAIFWLEEAIKNNDYYAHYALGHCYCCGDGVPLNYDKAYDYYIKALEINPKGIEAYNALGYLFVDDEYENNDLEKSVDYFAKAIKLGDESNFEYVATMYEGTKQYDKLFSLAYSLFELKSTKGIAYLGLCYKNGWGCNVDIDKAVDMFQKASNNNCVKAQYELALCYENGVGVSKSLQKAAQLLEMVALNCKEDDTLLKNACFAMNRIAIAFNKGNGVKEDKRIAYRLFQISAEKGEIPYACYQYGIYLDAQKKYGEAGKWFLKAANAGMSQGYYTLGFYYEKGLLGNPNLKLAEKYYYYGAKAGNADAQNNLGVLYLNHYKDCERAAQCFKLAADQGHELAIKNYKLTLEQQKRIGTARKWQTASDILNNIF